MFKNLNISYKLFIGFTIVLALMVIVNLLSYYRMESISTLMQKRDIYSKITKNISDIRLERNKYFYTSDISYKSDVDKDFNEISGLAKKALRQFPSAENQANFNKILKAVKDYKKLFGKYADMVAEKKLMIDRLNMAGDKAFDIAKGSGLPDLVGNLMMMRVDTLKYIHEEQSKKLEDKRTDYYNKAKSAAEYASSTQIDRPSFLDALLNYHSGFMLLTGTMKKLKTSEKQLLDYAHKTQALCDELSNHERANLQSSIVAAKTIILLMSALAVLAGLFIGFVISKSITKPMARAVDVANAMAEGDFTMHLQIKQKDEIGQFALALDNMRQKLRELINNLVQSSGSVASGSTQLAATTEELSHTINDQAGQVGMVASAVEQLSASSSQILTSISEVSGKSDSAKELTFQGQGCIDSANSVMIDIKSNVDELGTTVTSLAKSSEEIGNILLVINDIADQTNLLALNAAIEAARAGEHGRGFAVVADEVRKLAERTQDSIHEIENIISSFVSETTKTNKEMESAKGRVDEGVGRLNETIEIFDNIVRSVEEINEASIMITDAIKEQVDSINNINDNSHVISSGLEQSSAAVNQVTATVSNLQQQADSQMESTGIFKV